jgi:hypothetical protein
VSEKEKTTIAILGTDTMVGQALSLLLQGEGYEIRMVEAPRQAHWRV